MRRIAVAAVLALVAATLSVAADAAAATPSTPGSFVPVTQTRVLSAVLPAHGTQTPTLPGVPTTAEAAEVTITVYGSTASGGITAAKPGPVPGTTNLTYAAGATVSNTAYVALAAGKLEVYNNSSGSAHVLVDLQGYYMGGTVASTTPSLYQPVAPKRMASSSGPIAAGKYLVVAMAGGSSPVPSGAADAVVTVTVTSPTKSGAIIAYIALPRPTQSTLHFTAGQASSSTAVVPISALGNTALYNASSGSVKLTVDVVGYFTSGGNAGLAGTLQTLPIARAYAHSVAAKSTTSITLTGQGGVPVDPSLVSAVLVVVHVSFPTAPGVFVVYPDGTTRPADQSLSFGTGQVTSNVLQVPVSSTGAISVYNSAAGTATVTVDIYGYVRATDAVTPPPVSTGRYVRDITNTSIGSMQAQGQSDQSSKLVLLEFGAQTDDKVGVQLTTLTAPSAFVPYSQLTSAINAYLSGFGAHPGGATVAIGTNNDADSHAGAWTNFSPVARGQRWAQLLTTLRPPAGVTVVGADDIESGFYSTEAQAQAWENGYLGATSSQLVFNGSSDGCPQTLGSTAACNYEWTPAQIYGLAHNGSRIVALPQIYFQSQANQWANIDDVGGKAIVFAGVLDEFASEPGVVFMPELAYQSFYDGLSGVVKTPVLPTLVDLRVDG